MPGVDPSWGQIRQLQNNLYRDERGFNRGSRPVGRNQGRRSGRAR